MYNTLLRMRRKGNLTDVEVDKALAKRWITTAQANYLKSIPNGSAEN